MGRPLWQMHRALGEGRTKRPSWTSHWAWCLVYWLDAGGPLRAAALSAPSFPDGAATGKFAGETGRCWVMLGLLGAAGCISGSVCWGRITRGAITGAIAGAVVGAVVGAIVTTTATAATVLQ